VVSHEHVVGGVGRHSVGNKETGTARRVPLGEENAIAGELLDATVAGVRDVDVASGVGRDAVGIGELPVAAGWVT